VIEKGTAMRKPLQSIALLALLVATANHWPLTTAHCADWPQFLGPNRNGTSPETGLLVTWPDKGPPKVWEKEVGDGYSGPVVAGNRLILFHRLANNEVVECLDPANGKGVWKFEYPTAYQDDYGKGNGPRATPAIAGNKVYTLGAEGKLHCLDLEKGTKVWSRSLHDDYQVKKGFFGVATSPLVEGNLVLVNVGGKGAGIVAFNKDDGKEVWKATEQAASYSSPVAATIDGVRHVFFFTREGIVGLDPANGTVRFSKRWRARLDASVNAATPLVVDDLLFVTSSYSTGAILHRIKKDGIAEVWKGDQALSSHYNTPVVHQGYLYGLDGRQEGGGAELRCVELKTGIVKWSKERFGCASLILADGRLIALCENGDLVLVEPTPDSYKEKARARLLNRPVRAEPALVNGRLYARDDSKLICWNLKK
jgi:outer membrane protein assembly factor BamB